MKRSDILIISLVAVCLALCLVIAILLGVSVTKGGVAGERGPQGLPGGAGDNGKTAYEIYKEYFEKNNPGQEALSEEEWLESLKGESGSRGATWFYGDTIPTSELGNDGDFYFYNPNGIEGYIIYYKQNGTWEKVIEIPEPTYVATEDDFVDALNSGAKAALNDDLTLSKAYEAQNDQSIVVSGNGNTLSVIDDADRVINVQAVKNVALAINNVTLEANVKERTNGSYGRGISIYQSENVKVNVTNSIVKADHYPLNIAKGNTNVTLNVTNSTIQGYCAFQSWSEGSVITVDNCTLIGLNQWGTSEPNNFATIVVNYTATNNKITIKNTRIEANALDKANESFAFIDATGTELVFENCTFVKNGVELTDLDAILKLIKVDPEVKDSLTLIINGRQITTEELL